ncbi:MAG: cobamide remodeling phosphodiesterase CbiR [Acidobacteriota bacterium]
MQYVLSGGTGRGLKGRFPFRLGTTSYILPADIVPNVEYLAPMVDDVEVLIFESDEISSLPDTAAIERLVELALRHHLTYTVHLPLDIDLGACTDRRQAVGKCLRVIDRVARIRPFAYVLHLEPPDRRAHAPDETAEWVQAADESVGEIVESIGDPGLLCAETVAVPFERIEEIIVKHGLSICLDIGHMALHGYALDACLRRCFAKCRVIHLHGLNDGQDHRHIKLLDRAWRELLMDYLYADAGRERVLTIEVFAQEDLDISLDEMRTHIR